MTTSTATSLRFYLDPVCPWAWRAALWIREARQVRPINVIWDLFSLKAINQGTASLKEGHFKSEPSLRVMALLRMRYPAAEANELIDRFYLTVGSAAHERTQDIGDHEVVRQALRAAELDPQLLDAALADAATLDAVLASHNQAVNQGAFGVPTLVIERPDQLPTRGAYGPVINRVPTGEDAGQYWDHIAWLLEREEFFELKRSR